MKFDYDLLIIGAGSAGMAAAEVAPRMGVRVALAERDRIGGDCLWTGCVPSKALIASAKLAHRMKSASELGLADQIAAVDTAKVLDRVRAVQHDIAATTDSIEHFQRLGVDVLTGVARVRDEHSAVVAGRVITARFILLASGSRPSVPPIEGLGESGYLTSDTLFCLERLPSSLIVIGGGPIAVETSQAARRLGVEVTLLESQAQILGREDGRLAARVRSILEREGVSIFTGAAVERVELRGSGRMVTGTVDGERHEWRAHGVLVATGRAPNVEDLGLAEAGISTSPKGIVVDDRLRTSVSSIYAAGDVAGRFFFTHSAVSEAATALRNMFYPGSKPAPMLVPWTTFTEPELGHAGMTRAQAEAELGRDRILEFRAPLSESDRARADGVDGEFVCVTDTNYRLLGAHVLAPGAGDMMGHLAVAIGRGDRLTPDFANAIQVYPTISFTLSQLAAHATYRQLRRPFLRGMRRLADHLLPR